MVATFYADHDNDLDSVLLAFTHSAREYPYSAMLYMETIELKLDHFLKRGSDVISRC